jgi:hypothetical protein
VAELICICVEDSWLMPVYVVDMMMSVMITFIVPVAIMVAVVTRVRPMSILLWVGVRMISALMAMVEHGFKCSLHLVSMVGK